MSTKQFTLTINKAGLLSHGGLEIPAGFLYKGEITGLSFNTTDAEDNASPGVGYSGGFFKDANEEQALIIKNGLQQGPRGVHASFGGLAQGCVTIDDSTDDRVTSIDYNTFIAKVKANIAERLECEVTDIV